MPGLVTLSDAPNLMQAVGPGLHLGSVDATLNQLTPQVAAALKAQASAVLLHVGTSDLFKNTALTTFELGLKLLAKAFAPLGKTVCLTTVLDFAHAPVRAAVSSFFGIPDALFVRRIDELNDRLRLIARRSQFELIDLCALTRPELGAHPEYFAADGLHLAPPGLERLTALIVDGRSWLTHDLAR